MPITSSPQHELIARVAVALREALPIIIAGQVDETLLLALERLCILITQARYPTQPVDLPATADTLADTLCQQPSTLT